METLDLLEKLRQEIDECDKKIVEAFEKRMDIVLQILECKKAKGMGVFQPEREQQILEKVVSNLRNKNFSGEIKEVYREIMRVSRRLQSKRLFSYNIVLIGFMGTGKSAVGMQLSQWLGMPWTDTDRMIEEKAGMTIGEIFEIYGEKYFRELEKEVVQDLQHVDRMIISCGGGVILKDENVEALRKKGKLVLLQAGAETIYHRVKGDPSRPLLKDDMSIAKIRKILDERRQQYLKAAELMIDTENKSIDGVCHEIILQLIEKGKRNLSADSS